MAKKVTFQEIADSLGVSKGLVSLAIRNKYGVSEEMRTKIVLKAIEMGYEFKTPPARKDKTISLLIKNMGVLNEEFWRQCIIGIESECAKENVNFNIVGWTGFKDREDVAMNLLNNKVQGVIILNQCSTSLVEKIDSLNIPLVFVDMISPPAVSADHVMANNFNAGMQAVNYLLKKGHDNILLVGNIDYSFSFLQRYYGAMKAVKHAVRTGKRVECVPIIDCEKTHPVSEVYYNEENELLNESVLEKELKQLKGHAAIVCFNDSVLRRVVALAQKMGLNIPERLSVVGVDNVNYSLEHDITSIDIPKSEIGVQAVRLLIDRMENKRSNSINMELNTTLIERNSVRDLNYEEK
ncbi:MAG: LacI family DNA-binding transcriptional regulator [Clostridia bacterium]|nr:LacI family DNA-binding transcriptional regulator [Clostridia bacterium]